MTPTQVCGSRPVILFRMDSYMAGVNTATKHIGHTSLHTTCLQNTPAPWPPSSQPLHPPPLLQASGGRPAILYRMDTHMAVVNTAVLEAVGLMTPTGTVAAAGDVVHAAAAAADSEGLIVRDPNTGLPTGMLR